MSGTAVVRADTPVQLDQSCLGQALHDHMLNSDPPRHTSLHKMMSRAFTGRAGELVARLAERQTVDLIEEFAFPLPMKVICEILGVPDHQRAEFSAWSHTLLSSAPFEQYAAAAPSMGAYPHARLDAQPRAVGAVAHRTDDVDRRGGGVPPVGQPGERGNHGSRPCR
ncbi:MAG TPA: hypothetical protein VK735_28310 [Pseudonocardia sp.]|uniref:hypothetical protein n=1 Tax=Pseudonocardia sp. TaxID=60912 RepID=UPI002BACD8DE|nr:hypothetical protein [Pseudonocardia sp.]HTF51365.1 hypothetical protein [Pseudonocardia sp.]